MNKGIYISLRFVHPTDNVHAIVERMGLEIKRSWRAGDLRKTPDGMPLLGTCSQSYVVCDVLNEREGSLSEIISLAIKRIQPFHEELVNFVENNGKCSFYIGLDKNNFEGASLDWPLLLELGKLKISLEIDREF